ncbi:hypothetical protein OG596_12900 [Streptomyces sp. NBC_01102]|nr:hypothetical protein OG596_12900 [Streptomyces sp. NBC_01102]
MAAGPLHATAPGRRPGTRPGARRGAPHGPQGAGRSLTLRNLRPPTATERHRGGKVTTVHPFRWCDGQPSVAPPVCPLTVVPLRVADQRRLPTREIEGCARADRTPHGRWLSVCDR